MKLRIVAIAVALIIAGIVILSAGRFPSKPKPGQEPLSPATPQAVSVVIGKPTVGEIAVSKRFTGRIKTLREVKVAAKIGGKTREVLVEEGQAVRRGQLLVRLEQQEILAQLAQGEAALVLSKVRLTQARLGMKVKSTQTSSAIIQANESLKAARHSASQAQTSYELQKVQTQVAVTQAQANLDAARARLAQAKTALELQKVQSQVAVTQAQASLDAVKVRLSQARSVLDLSKAQTENAVAQAQTNVAAARERLNTLLAGSRAQERRAAEEDVTQAREQRDIAKKELERMRSLLASDAVSQQQYDNAETAYDIAKSRLDAAEQRRSLVQEGPRPEEINLAREHVRLAEQGLALARANTAQVDVHRHDVDALKEQLRQAEDTLTLARAGQAKVDINSRDVDALAEQVRQAEEALRLAQAGTANVEIGRRSVETARTGVTRAKDSVRLARTDKLQNAINREEVNAAEANVRANEANLAYLRAQLDNTYVRSPIDGIVQKRATNPGEGVDSGKMLILVVDAARLYADIEVADTSLAFLPVGKTVEVNVDALPREKFQGVVREILPVADPQSRAFTVRIGLYNPDSRLKPGMFARVEVALSQKTRALIIPRDVIVERDQRKNVFVVDSRKIAQLRPVTTGILKEDKAEITGGLRSTDTIILKGQQYVKPGDVVTTAQ